MGGASVPSGHLRPLRDEKERHLALVCSATPPRYRCREADGRGMNPSGESQEEWRGRKGDAVLWCMRCSEDANGGVEGKAMVVTGILTNKGKWEASR